MNQSKGIGNMHDVNTYILKLRLLRMLLHQENRKYKGTTQNVLKSQTRSMSVTHRKNEISSKMLKSMKENLLSL